jgi:hypothetical protein
VREIALSRGLVALVDDEDYHRVIAVDSKWYAKRHRQTDYARRNVWVNGKRTTVTMHAMITGCPKGLLVDHRDGNGLNNRRENLRVATNSQNSKNKTRKAGGCSSRHKGVCWSKRDKVWRASIAADGKWKHLGNFKSEAEALSAYARASVLMHGEYAAPYVEAEE